MARGVIYKITNNVNGKLYVGQTTRGIEKRWKEHCQPSSECSVIKRAVSKHGKDNFSIEIVAEGNSLAELNILEEKLIIDLGCRYPKGYNLQMGGSNHTHSEISKRLMSQKQVGRIQSKETREKIRAKAIGRKHSAEFIKNRLGDKNPNAKIKNDDIPMIQKMYEDKVKVSVIAKKYGVHEATIYLHTKRCRGLA